MRLLPIVARALPIVGIVALVMQLALWLPLQLRGEPGADVDFTVYRRAAMRMAAGGSPYAACDPDRAIPPNCFMYPPPFAALLRPVDAISPGAFKVGAYLVMLAAFWLLAAALARLALGVVDAPGTLAAGGLAAMTPGLSVTMSGANADLVVWALVASALTTEAALPLLVVAAAFKLWPAVPLVVLLVRRPARLPVVAATAIAIFGATVVMLGWSSFSDWMRWGLTRLQAGTLSPLNVSLATLPERLGFAVPGLIAGALAPAAAATVAILARRQPERVQAMLAGLAGLLFAPICWWHYLPIALIPAAIWVGAHHRSRLRELVRAGLARPQGNPPPGP
jgi:Glycosyltransferase family 87